MTLAEINRHCGLWEWNDNDIVVNFYPHEQEETTRRQRKAALNTNQGAFQRGESILKQDLE